MLDVTDRILTAPPQDLVTHFLSIVLQSIVSRNDLYRLEKISSSIQLLSTRAVRLLGCSNAPHFTTQHCGYEHSQEVLRVHSPLFVSLWASLVGSGELQIALQDEIAREVEDTSFSQQTLFCPHQRWAQDVATREYTFT